MDLQQGVMEQVKITKNKKTSSTENILIGCFCLPMKGWKELLKKNRIVIIRHGNTNSVKIDENLTFKEKDELDLSRSLTEKGKSQCKQASETYLQSLLPLSNIYISSVAQRCQETSFELLKNFTKEIIKIDANFLYPFLEENQKSEELFDLLKYNSLDTYFKHENSDFFLKFADMALEEIYKLIQSRNPSEGTILIFCHAVYSNSIAFRLSQLLQKEQKDLDLISSVNLGEVEGFLIDNEPVLHLK
jgi:broad specificity phosphatase PhoE